jgi:hypothetical protein
MCRALDSTFPAPYSVKPWWLGDCTLHTPYSPLRPAAAIVLSHAGPRKRRALAEHDNAAITGNVALHEILCCASAMSNPISGASPLPIPFLPFTIPQ